MTATNLVSRTRGYESATAVRCQWLAMFTYAAHMGKDRVVDPASGHLQSILEEESSRRGADTVIVAAPVHGAQDTALESAAISRRIIYFASLPKDHSAINFNSNLVHYKWLVVISTTACSAADCWQANQIVNSGLVNLSDIISQRFPLAEAVRVFAAAEDGKSLKIVLEP